MKLDEYKTIKKESTGLFKDRGSKFIGIAIRVSTIEGIHKRLDIIRKEYHDARHHCYAYKLGTGNDIWRVNDDGEPSGSAGKPILGQIHSFEITNVLIVVVRYFGGTLLGVGGLIKAYREASKNALLNNTIITELVMEEISISFPYDSMNDVMKIIKEAKIEQLNQKFETTCSLSINVRLSQKDTIIDKLQKVEGLSINVDSQ